MFNMNNYDTVYGIVKTKKYLMIDLKKHCTQSLVNKFPRFYCATLRNYYNFSQTLNKIF